MSSASDVGADAGDSPTPKTLCHKGTDARASHGRFALQLGTEAHGINVHDR